MLEVVLIFAAGVWAGAINVMVGSGTLVTFPTLLLFGYPPLVANISNNVGMVAGGLSGTFGYRRELRGSRSQLLVLIPACCGGAIAGALLLLVLPAAAFGAIVPVLIALGLVMVLAGPAVQRRASARTPVRATPVAPEATERPVGRRLRSGVFAVGIYGGYFGAAQGILLVGVMSMSMRESLQRINALKNVLATVVNVVAAATFVAVAFHFIDWSVVGLIAAGTFVGGYVGAKIGRRLPPVALKAVIVTVGLLAIAKMTLW